ncbi:MAG: RIP metalloprotease RseP [Clostridioides sp.]|nr:RIP metalloprotease RseP [Clostridioides sp.]
MTIIVAIILFGVIIFIHELGHFSFAKMSGVLVHEFSIGMGPKIISRKRGETEYSIRAFPIGGYVSMEGEDEDSKSPRAFGKKTIPQRLSVIFAGPIFNLILAVILLIPVFMVTGVPTQEAIIGEVQKSSPAQVVGVESGDRIVDINDKKIDSWETAVNEIRASKGKKLEMTVLRDGKEKELAVTPKLEKGVYLIGISQFREKGVIKSIVSSFTATGSMSVQMVKFVGQLVTGTVPGGVGNSVAGPVGVIGMVSDAAKTGFINLLYFGSIISLNLGILNLLPFPALDGWRILMIIIEGLRGGKKFDPNKEGMVNLIGLGVLMVFMIFVTYKDILRLFK